MRLRHRALLVCAVTAAFLLVPAGAAAASGFLIQQAPVSASRPQLHEITFVDALHGWAVGDSSLILTTADGGDTWTRQKAPIGDYVDVDFTDGSNGWALASSDGWGAFTRTTTGGGSWPWIKSPSDLGIYSTSARRVDFADALHGVAATAGFSMHTADGGITWAEPSSTNPGPTHYAAADPLRKVITVDAEHVWVVSGLSVSSTQDGGENWLIPLSAAGSASPVYGSADFTSALHGTVVGTAGLVKTTFDGGITWSDCSISGGTDLSDVVYTSPLTGVAQGAGKLWQTADGGFTWTGPIVVPSSLRSLTYAPGGALFAISNAQDIARSTDQGATWSWCRSVPARVATSVKDLQGTAALNATHAVAVGKQGALETTADGDTWIPRVSGTGIDLAAVDYADADHLWAVGAAGTLLSSSDGGATWVSGTSGVATDLDHVCFVDALHGWIGGSGGTVRRTEDGGATWTPCNTGEAGAVTALQFIDAQHGWVLTGNHVLRTSDGGATWHGSFYFASTATDLSFVDASHGMVVGADGFIATSTDGGATWTPQTAAGSADFLAVVWEDASTIWGLRDVTGDDSWNTYRSLCRSTDGGATWYDLRWRRGTADYSGGSAISAGSATQGWVVGDAGVIGASPSGRDVTAPTTTLPGVTLVNTSRDVTLSAVDEADTSDGSVNSGVAATFWFVDQGETHAGTTVHLTVAPDHSLDGPHTAYFYSTDEAGNEEDLQWRTYTIDTVPPQTHCNATAEWYNHVIYGILGSEDGATAHFRIDGGPWHDGAPWHPWQSDSFFFICPADGVAREGTYVVDYYSTDAAGNDEPVQTRTYHIDTTPPVTTDDAPKGWVKHAPVVAFAAHDIGSGVVRTCYRYETLDELGPWTDGTTVDTSLPGTYCLKTGGVLHLGYQSTDAAGNAEPPRSCTVRVDTTRPITLAPRESVALYRRAARLAYRINDVGPGSGHAKVTITIRKRSGGVVARLHLGAQPIGMDRTAVCRRTLPRGRYRFTVTAVDSAGNAQSRAGSNALAVR